MLQGILTLILQYLHWIILAGGVTFFLLFIRQMRGSGKQKIIMMACQWGDTPEVRALIDEVPWLAKAADQNGFTPLHVTATWGHEDLVRLLIDRGADVNAQNRAGMTPLHCASMAGHEGVVRILVDRGANVHLIDGIGNSPLYFAVWDGYTPIVKLLLQHGAKTDTRNNRDETPLTRAERNGHQEIILLLRSKDASPAAPTQPSAVLQRHL